ncbi:D-alanyl-D-alanine carboxypeptidase [Candidatus Pelagibacter sp.]|nr:D-alanyl-D-alanine carboxypeptidase [Candidatus Pelagibacter sp.]
MLLNNCTATTSTKNISSNSLDNPFINKGFSLIYNDKFYYDKVISKKIDERSLIIFQKNLKKNTIVKITNILNNKSIIGTVGSNADYPLFNNAVLSLRIADEIGLNENEPYVEILEVLEDAIFVAKRAKTFEEEKKVADKAPVNNINISDLNTKQTNTKNELNKNFSYEIKIADFYFNDTASLLINRIVKETLIKDAKIKKINEKKYRVYAGPFNNINSLQKSFNDISILEFENIEIIKKMIKLRLITLLLTLLLTANANAAFDVKARTAILQDYLSGEILFEKDADKSIYPASMTKIMTAIIAFDLIRSGDLNLDEKFLISENAWRLSSAGYSSMFIMVGDEVSVENLLRGIIVASGNDACVSLAEGIAGTEDEFAVMMTAKAKEIGMDNTNFANSSGINNTENVSTVRDIMIMSRYLIKEFPEEYKYFAEKEFTWDRTGGDPITQGNRNPLLYKSLGADGIKTGYLAVEKYSLASSVERNGRRLIAVGSGFNTKNDRSRESAKLLTWGLTNFDLVEITRANTPIEDIGVWLGKKDTVKTYIKNDIYKTIPKAKKRLLKLSLNYNGPIQAPIKKDDILGKLKLTYNGDLIEEYDLLAYEDVKKLNVFSRLMKSINFLIWGDV